MHLYSLPTTQAPCVFCMCGPREEGERKRQLDTVCLYHHAHPLYNRVGFMSNGSLILSSITSSHLCSRSQNQTALLYIFSSVENGQYPTFKVDPVQFWNARIVYTSAKYVRECVVPTYFKEARFSLMQRNFANMKAFCPLFLSLIVVVFDCSHRKINRSIIHETDVNRNKINAIYTRQTSF